MSELRNSSLVLELVRRGLALAVHDIGLGGLSAALAEMSVLGGVGVEVDLERVPCRGCLRVDEVVFSETQARYVIEVRAGGVEEVLRLAGQVGVEVSVIGRTVARGVYRLRFGSTVAELPLDTLRDAYLGGLERYFR